MSAVSPPVVMKTSASDNVPVLFVVRATCRKRNFESQQSDRKSHQSFVSQEPIIIVIFFISKNHRGRNELHVLSMNTAMMCSAIMAMATRNQVA